MNEPEFRLKLTAEGDIAKQVEMDVAAMNKLDAAAKKNAASIAAWNRQRSSLARQRRQEAFEELSTAEKLTRLREKQLVVERRIAAAQNDPRRSAALKLRQAQISEQIGGLQGTGLPPVLPGMQAKPDAGGGKPSLAARLLGKALPGGGMAGAITGGLGGSLAVTGAVGGIFAGVYGVKALIAEAKALDTTAEATSKRIAEQYRMSNSAIDTLSAMGTMFETVWAFVKMLAAETLAGALKMAADRLGTLISVLGQLASFIPGATAQRISGKMTEVGDTMIAFGTGQDLGYQAAGAAQQRLDAALKDREERRQKEREEARDKSRKRGRLETLPEFGGSGFQSALDDLAKMGLYRGAGANGTLALQQKQLAALENLHKELRATPIKIAENL